MNITPTLGAAIALISVNCYGGEKYTLALSEEGYECLSFLELQTLAHPPGGPLLETPEGRMKEPQQNGAQVETDIDEAADEVKTPESLETNV